jgi:hypothetical protein
MNDLFGNQSRRKVGAESAQKGGATTFSGTSCSAHRRAPTGTPDVGADRRTRAKTAGRAYSLADLRKEAEGLYLELMQEQRQRDAFKAKLNGELPRITAARERLVMHFEIHGHPPTPVGWKGSRPLYEELDRANRAAYPFREGLRVKERLVKAIMDRIKDINMELDQ